MLPGWFRSRSVHPISLGVNHEGEMARYLPDAPGNRRVPRMLRSRNAVRLLRIAN